MLYCNFTFGCHSFHLRKWKIIFELACRRNSERNSQVFRSWNYWSDSFSLEINFDVLKTCIFAYCFKSEHQISSGQLSADSSSTETLYCLNRNTRESLGELEKAVETLACGSSFPSISPSLKLPLMVLKLNRNRAHVFYF